MAHAPSSVLVPAPQPLIVPLIAAVFLHACAATGFVAWEWAGFGRRPVLDLSERSLQVEYAVMKKADGMPRIATVAPRPAGAPAPEPAAPQAPRPAPDPPPVQSDLAFHQDAPDAAPAPRDAPTPRADAAAARERALREAQLRAALESARAGDRDQEATDPRGTGDRSFGSGSALVGDPELARWKARAEAAFHDPFSPLPTVVSANPGISAVYRVHIDPDTGRVLRYEVLRSSGNASYDAAVERAIASVRAIDPPPARFRDVVGRILDVTFEPPGS